MNELQKAEQTKLGMLQTLIDSKKLPVHIKTVEEAIAVAQMGKELGFPTMQAFHYIIPIQGRLSLSAKAIGAVLRKGGVKFTTKEDGVLVYASGGTEKKDDADKAVDRRTTIVFTRDTQVEECSYLWSDAVAAGYSEKDNWKRMKREMMYARCLSKGANRIGQDLLLGLYMTDELFDVSPLKETQVTRDEDGTIVEVYEASNEATTVKN